MEYRLLEALYDCFYVPPDFQMQRQEMAECRQILAEVLGKPERKMVLQIIDAKDYIIESISIDSFIAGFELAWQLSAELNRDENERLSSWQTGSLGARFISKKEERI